MVTANDDQSVLIGGIGTTHHVGQTIAGAGPERRPQHLTEGGGWWAGAGVIADSAVGGGGGGDAGGAAPVVVRAATLAMVAAAVGVGVGVAEAVLRQTCGRQALAVANQGLRCRHPEILTSSGERAMATPSRALMREPNARVR